MNQDSKHARNRLKSATRQEFDKLIYDAMLTPLQEKIIRLYICDDLSINAISERFGYSYSGIHKLINRIYNAVNNGIRDVITAGTANTQQLLNGLNEVIRTNQQGTQTIIDKLCALELDNVKRENADLRTRLQMADLAASQTAQTAQILQGQTAQAQYITNTCCPKPIPAYTVPNPGCGCGGFNG